MKRSDWQIFELLEPTITSLGLQLWGIEHSTHARSSVLRIIIESDNGITIEDCERVSRQVSAVLDVEDPIAGEYTLEVSSPGADRRLFTLKQFQQYLGSSVNIRLRTLINGRRQITGVLHNVVEETIEVDTDGDVFQCPFDAIEKANIVF